MIESKDLSVVVQGGITKYAESCLRSIRRYLPQAEIVLSTWKDVDTSGLDYDVLVLNKDPGGQNFLIGKNKPNNINRIIVSSKAGLERATRKYTLLIRNDLVLCNRNVLKLEDNYKRNQSVSLFKRRIFSYELFSLLSERGAEKCYQSIFHVSDWCRFGLTEDLQELFNISTVKEPEFSTYKLHHKYDHDRDIFFDRTWKMSPEQYIISENAKKIFTKLNVKNCLDWRESVLNASNEFIVNNFIVKSISDWGIKILKPEYKNRNINSFEYCRGGQWVGKNWFINYKKYINPNFIIPLRYNYTDVLKIERDISKFRRYIKNVYAPVKVIFHYVKSVLYSTYYAMRILLKTIYHGSRYIVRRVTH